MANSRKYNTSVVTLKQRRKHSVDTVCLALKLQTKTIYKKILVDLCEKRRIIRSVIL